MEDALLDTQAALNWALGHLSRAATFARTEEEEALIEQAAEAIEASETEVADLWEDFGRSA
jgi:hypothetical protein